MTSTSDTATQSMGASQASALGDEAKSVDNLEKDLDEDHADVERITRLKQGEMPFAFVNGQAYTTLPKDLYIPPDALEIILEAFEGPLDLLLYLIRRQNIDILEIDVSAITHQYVAYVELLDTMHFELAAEYLVMAAMLA
jgi:segregation and condensation protein A